MSLEAWGDEFPDEGVFDRAIEAGWINPEDLSSAAIDVLAERDRQQDVEGWTPEHDDAHDDGEMAKAAACYAWISAQSNTLRDVFDGPPPTWPSEWDSWWWKPTTRRRDLVKAGALILAEIERLDRATAGETQK